MGWRVCFMILSNTPRMSLDMTKPTKWVCAQRSLRSAWASAQSDQSSLSAWRKLGSLATQYPLSAQWRLWADWADAQADLRFWWMHTHFVGFIILTLPNWIQEQTFSFMRSWLLLWQLWGTRSGRDIGRVDTLHNAMLIIYMDEWFGSLVSHCTTLCRKTLCPNHTWPK